MKLRRDTKKAVEGINKKKEEYIKQGLSKEEAHERAWNEARDNPRKNIKRRKEDETRRVATIKLRHYLKFTGLLTAMDNEEQKKLPISISGLSGSQNNYPACHDQTETIPIVPTNPGLIHRRSTSFSTPHAPFMVRRSISR
jgi:hypothetical protein